LTSLQLLISAIVSGVVAALSALAVQWTTWGIDQRRAKLARRQQLIDQWRAELIKINFNEQEFIGTEAYASLRPHLSGDLAKKHRRRAIRHPSRQ
jgi:hypothetical protein